jgi:hypothetical protein
MENVPFGKFGFVKKRSVDWVVKHFSLVGFCALVLIVGLTTLSRWIRRGVLADYIAVETAYRGWDGKVGPSFFTLQQLLKANPKLHERYDGAVAQKLLVSSEMELAKNYGQAALKEVGSVSSRYYTDFSQTTLLIGEQKFKEALEKARQLKVVMEQDDDFWDQGKVIIRYGNFLYAFNLLRIAMLEGSTAGTPQGELAAWQELKKNAGWSPLADDSTAASLKDVVRKTYDPQAYESLEENFKTNEISLLDYINYREEAIREIVH